MTFMPMVFSKKTMKQLKRLVIVLLVLVLSACSAPKYLSEKASFEFVIKDKVSLQERTQEIQAPSQINFYMEPTSSSAIRLFKALETTIFKLVELELSTFKVSPLIYLNSSDHNPDSLLRAGVLSTTVEVAPEHAQDVMGLVLNDTFEENDLNKVLDQKLTNKIIKNKDKYVENLIEGTRDFVENKYEVLEVMKDGVRYPFEVSTFKEAEKDFINFFSDLFKDDDVLLQRLQEGFDL